MASRDVEIRLVAKDGSTQIFRQVGRAADQMGRDIEDAGQKSARSLSDAKQAGQDLAIGIGALAGAFTLAARSQQSAEQASRTLTRQYGDEADALRLLAEQIQDTTNFSNDQAIAAANTFGTLRREYGLTQTQIETLIQVSADLATTAGIGLVDASQRVAAAVRGEGESIELLGIVANDASLGIDRMAKTTTNAEKAQIRYTAITEQATFAQGAAQEAAQGTRGAVFDLAHSVQDAAQDFAEWTGVTGEAVAAASDFTLQLALMGGGLVKLGSGIRGLAGAAGIGGLAASLGPVGLVAAAGLGAAALFTIVDAIHEDYEPAMEAGVEATEKFSDAVRRMLAAGDPMALMAQPWQATMETINVGVGSTIDRLHDLELEFLAIGGTPMGKELGPEIDRLTDLLHSMGLTADGAREELDETNAALETIFASIQSGAAGSDLVLRDLDRAFDELARTGDVGQFFDTVQAIEDSLARYDETATRVTAANQELGGSASDAAADVDTLTASTDRATDSFIGINRVMRDASIALEEYTEGGERAALGIEAANDAIQRGSDRLRQYEERARSAADIPPPVAPTLESDVSTITATTVALTDQEIAYQNLTNDILTANEAQAAFKVTQDGLIESQSVFTQQQSEYGQQLDALQEAEDLLNQRRAEGVALTAEQEDFLNRVDAAQDRLTGGVEDAVIAEGMLALQYAENVRIGDQLNETMAGQQAITGALIDLVADLIGALDGIPEDVRTDIELIGADTAINQAASLAGTLAAIPASVRTEVVTAFVQSGTPGLAGLAGGIQFGTGGTVHDGFALPRGAATGITVGEFGPEFIPNPSPGIQVMPHGASMSRMQAEGRRGERAVNVHIHGDVYGVDDLERTIDRALRRHVIATGR